MSGNDHGPGFHQYERTVSDDSDSEGLDSQSTEYKRYNIFSRSEWLLEICTSILSLILLAGLGAIFHYMDNKPLSDWKPFISLNTTTAILTTSCTALLMHGVSEFIGQLKWLHFKTQPQKLENFERFDEASRGPWGSFKFLFIGKPSLATLGALVTILRLGFPSLAQQALSFDERPINISNSNVQFGYAHMYNRPGLRGRLANSDDYPGMQSAVLRGLYGIDSLETFNCPGACIWDSQYISLGFKSECTNVIQETLRSNKCSGGTYNSNCNMTTPGGLNISTRFWATDYATGYRMSTSSSLGPAQIKLPSTFPEIARFAIYRSIPDTNFRSFNINITDCTLSLTAYQYTSAESNGTEISFGEAREVDFGTKNPWRFVGDINMGAVVTNASEAKHLPALNVSYVDLRALQNFFVSDFIVTEWVDGNWKNSNFGLSAALMGDVNITQRFEKMATSMTNYLRSGPNKVLVKGKIIENQSFVSIRWGWFTGPAAIELLGLGFAVFSIYSNRKSRKVPLWKSSAIALLACRHDKEARLIRSNNKDIKKIEKMAEEILVQLE